MGKGKENIQNSESELTEFKTSFKDDVIETLVAFANTHGGTVYIGISDNGKISGVTIGKETLQKWLNEIKLKTQPAIIPTIKLMHKEGKNIVAIAVHEFPVKPLSFKGRYYKRINNSNHQLSPAEITEMNLQSLQLSWDSYIKPDKSIADLDVTKIARFINQVNSSGRFHLTGDWQKDLQKLRLISGEKITNAAWLLFANGKTEYNVHLGRFKTPSLIIDDKMLNSTLFDAVEETINYIQSSIKVTFEITGKTSKRNEIFEYPLPALRELVLNTIIHRDYLSPIDIQIKIFDNNITFYNPGSLYGSLTLEQLKGDYYQANTRNKLIAESFYLTGGVEKYGTGFIRIRKEIKSYPTMEFSFANAPNGFLTGLSYTQQKLSEQKSEGVSEGVIEGVIEGVNSLYKMIGSEPGNRIPYYSLKLNVPIKTVERWIKQLKGLGRIEYKGSARSGGYYLIEK